MNDSILSIKKQKIFCHAYKLAQDSDMLYRHGCIAVRGGKIIERGCNTYKCYSARDMFLQRCCSCHAEVNVLRKMYYKYKHNYRKMNKIMKNTTLYISRHSNSDKSADSAPCSSCIKIINNFNIKKIIFYHNEEYHMMNANKFHSNHVCLGDQYLDRVHQ